MPITESYITPEEAAAVFKVTTKTIREWIRLGRLKGVKIGKIWRIKETDFKAFIAQLEKGK